MKKLLKFLAIAMCVLLLLSLTACGSFMSASQVKKAVNEFGTPQAKMTLSFSSSSGTKWKYVITYDLLLEKTPITVINFINLVEDGFYKDVIFDTYNSTNNYFLAGRYAYRAKGDDEDKKQGYVNASGITMTGEFKVNNYPEPNGGYEQFSLFSLAMYHDNDSDSVNSANGALIFSTSASSAEAKKSLNYTNYAVFARVSSIDVYKGDEKTPRTYSNGMINDPTWQNLISKTSTTSIDMTKTDGTSDSVSVLGTYGSGPNFIFSIEMVDSGKDWSKLPKVN